MLTRLLLLFVTVPLVELTLLLVLAKYTDWWVSILVVLVSGTVGAMLAHQQGLLTLRRVRFELQQGRLPADALLDALLILFAGGLLLTPGILTDVVGVSLLIPACRSIYKRWLRESFQGSVHFTSSAAPGPRRQSQVIDSYIVDREE